MIKAKTNITSATKALVLRLHKSRPDLGVRLIAQLLKDKYDIIISKSTIQNILSVKGIKVKAGRKQDIIKYKSSQVGDCGLALLLAMDSRMGIFDYVAQKLQPYFPKIDQKLLKKFVIFATFSGLMYQDFNKTSAREGFSRLAGLYSLPKRKFAQFITKIEEHKPSIGFQELAQQLQMVTTLRITCLDGSVGFCDASMITFWDNICNIDYFYMPLAVAQKNLEAMVSKKVFMVNYSKSFDYLSPVTIKFINGIYKGIKQVEFIGYKSRVLAVSKFEDYKPFFFIGYYPRALSKGINFIGKAKRYRKLSWMGDSVFHTSILTRFVNPKFKQSIILNSLMLRGVRKTLPTWGLLTNKRRSIESSLADYLRHWPYMDKSFQEDLNLIEKFFSHHDEKKGLGTFLPQYLELAKQSDFLTLGEILGGVFRQEIGVSGIRNKSGQIIKGKDYYNIVIKSLPARVKKDFNKACLFIDSRRVYII